MSHQTKATVDEPTAKDPVEPLRKNFAIVGIAGFIAQSI